MNDTYNQLGAGVSRQRVRKAAEIVRWVYSLPNDETESLPARGEMIWAMREFSNLGEDQAIVNFWRNVAESAKIRPPSQQTVDITLDLLQLIEDVV